jgi:hypothetical protein
MTSRPPAATLQGVNTAENSVATWGTAGQLRVYRSDRWCSVIGILLMAAGPMPAPAVEGFDRARALYENHCRSCHESWAHTRDGRVVDSRDALRVRVASWSLHTGLAWTDEEIDAVTRYLDRRFYGFAP